MDMQAMPIPQGDDDVNIKTNATFDAQKGTLTLDFDLVGTSELDHELLAQFFRDDLTSNTDNLHARLVMKDPGAFSAALRNLENRKRKADGRPTLEEEAKNATAAKATQEAAQKRSAEEAVKVENARAASQDRIEKLAAKEIADREMAKKQPPDPAPQKVAEVAAPEPEKVQ